MKKCKKRICKLMVAIVMCMLMIGTSITVFASTSSNWQTKTVYGYSYDYCSSVWERGFTSGHTLEAVAEVITTNRTNAPTGYMGAQARLYTSSGTLLYSSNMVYNSSPVINVYAYSDRTTNTGYFYAQSKVSFYNGNGYSSYVANRSPNATVTTTSTIGSYAVNAQNETYGSGLLAEELGVEPDLIAAVGVDGVEGYVRAKDIAPVPNTIEEALEMTENSKCNQIIPLYNLEGEIVGEFILTAVEDKEIDIIRKEFD